MSPPSGASSPASVVAAVLASDGDALSTAIEAVGLQVYEASRRFVVGGDADARRLAEEAGFSWAASIPAFLRSLTPDDTFVWFLRERARPRADALSRLVGDAERTGASIAGSKIVQSDAPERLLAVGAATDAFEVSYRGFESEEVDQGQYDVVRDVAVVLGISVLVRRDLIQGLRGIDPRLAPEAAAVDLCQRARLRGARVVVVPSSEVLYPEEEVTGSPWREEAGRIRAMLKVYSPLTLLWALPGVFFIGLVEGLVAPFLGRWTLFAWIRAWLWNAALLPDTYVRRRRARRGRVVGDEELFRFQVRGSAKLKALFGEVATKIRTRLPEGRFDLAELGREISRPAFVAGFVGLLFAFVATRSIWQDGLPVSGYALPPAEGAGATLQAYAGGWNPAGFGSPEPLRPIVGLTAIVQFLLFDHAALTAAVLTVAAFVFGVLGMARLLRGFGFESFTGYLAGIVLLGGQAARALAGSGDWGGMLALGVLPWAIRTALRPLPPSWRGRIGRVAGIAWTTGLLAALSPILIVAPLVAAVVWVGFGEARSWPAVGVTGAGSAIAFLLLFPWAGTARLDDVLTAGTEAYWEPWSVLAGAALICVLAALGAGDRPVARVAAWGGILAAAGTVAARSGDFGSGREVESAGLTMAAFGIAVAAGAILQMLPALAEMSGARRFIALIGVVAMVPLLAATAALGVPGRAGLPANRIGDALGFTAAQEGDPAGSRILLLGDGADLPGDARDYEGAGYRVVSAPLPTLSEAWLSAPRLGDEALEDALQALITGDVSRAGAVLDPFGIRWVVALGDSGFSPFFDGQLDLAELGGVGFPAYRNEAAAVRAVTDSGTPWVWTGTAYEGGAVSGGRTYLAENGDARWGPEPWVQAGWANEIAADAGRAELRPDPGLRRQAQAALALLIVLLVVSIWGRRARRSR